jgi:hypothetical protein
MADVKPRKLVLTSYLAPGDITVFTATVRDLHRRYPGQFVTDVCTSCEAIWENNPYITKLQWRKEKFAEGDTLLPNEFPHLKDKSKIVALEPDIEVFNCNYDKEYPASVNGCNDGAYHFIHGYAQDLGKQLGLDIPITKLAGDIHLSKDEMSWFSRLQEDGIQENFWIIVAGGKYDVTCKWWNPGFYQRVVDHFKGRILFVQVGDRGHWHPRLSNVIDLIGKTNLRQFIRLVYHSDGVLCPVTAAMHLAAAVPVRERDNFNRKKPRRRPCVVIAGGREPPHWECYDSHSFLDSVGMLSCCNNGGCWRSRCQIVGDGDEKDKPENLCLRPVKVTPSLSIPECMMMITPDDVINRIEKYLWWMNGQVQVRDK